MTLGIDVGGQLPFFQQQAESIMTNLIEVTREGEPVWDEATGKYIPTIVPVYDGNARVRDSSASGSSVDDAGAATAILNLTISIPLHDPADVRIGDVAEVMESPTNPRLVGRRYRIKEPIESTYASARRFLVQRYVSRE